MKRILLLVLLLFIVGCEPTEVTNDIDCETYPTHKDCQDEPIDPGDPGEPLDETGSYDNLGNGSDIVYDGRDLVPTECDHLENIGEWQPVWCDEFEYVGLPDEDRWSYDIGGSGWGNNELQYYTYEDEDNAYVDNGVLRITTIKESMNGNDYSSARLVTKYKGDWLYGKVQVRAKLPAGLGTWPAIWMLPTNWEYGGWPESGEIDIMEYVGYQPNTIHGTIHTGKYNHGLGTQVGRSTTVSTAEEEFHLYEMEWEPGVIHLYIDGRLLASFDYDPNDNTSNDSYMAWPFDKEFHLIINTAFGGNWGGAQGTDPSIMPVEFIIDYVRVYQKDYSGMDTELPGMVGNLRTTNVGSTDLFVTWDHAEDDVMVKEYLVYLDEQLIAITSVNGHYIEGLDPNTSYTIDVVARDFAGNESSDNTVSVSTTAPPSINDRIEAEDYTDMVGIQTENTQDVGGGLNVGWFDSGDSLTYVLEVTESGLYEIDFRLASASDGAHFRVTVDGSSVIVMDTAATGSWQTWETFTSNPISLSPGTYTFTIEAIDGGFNINYFEFEKVE